MPIRGQLMTVMGMKSLMRISSTIINITLRISPLKTYLISFFLIVSGLAIIRMDSSSEEGKGNFLKL